MTNLNAVFQFGVDNGYLADNPFKGISPLKESRTIPDPLSREEFIRLIDACRNQQAKNLWCVSVYTGVRPGELCTWKGGHRSEKWNNDDQEKFSKRPFHGTKNTGGNQSGHSSY